MRRRAAEWHEFVQMARPRETRPVALRRHEGEQGGSMKVQGVVLAVLAIGAMTGCCECERVPEAAPGGGFPKLVGPYLGQEPPGAEPVLFAPGLVSTGAQELSLCASPDGRELYYFVTGPAYNPRIIMWTRLGASGWTEPSEVEFFSSNRSDSYPFVTPDGEKIFFNSSRSSTGEEAPGHHHEIWVAGRVGEGWGEPRKLDLGGEGTAFGTFPSVAANGNLYFNGGSEASGSDILVSRFDGVGYGLPENLGDAVNSDAGDFHPFIAPDESYLLFDSQREEGGGANDLYISVRDDDGTWGQAQNLGEVVNTEYGDLRPFVTADGLYLFFASNRPVPAQYPDGPLSYEETAALVDGPGNRMQDIYWVSAEMLDAFIK
jgi:hypothetical protein